MPTRYTRCISVLILSVFIFLFLYVVQAEIFEDVRMAGMSSTADYIYIEMVPADAIKLLQRSQSTAKSMRIRLTKKAQNPYMSFDMKFQVRYNLSSPYIISIPYSLDQQETFAQLHTTFPY